MVQRKLRIAILASGSGSNLGALLEGCRDGRVAAEPVAMLSNNPEAFALERGRKAGLPALVADHRAFASREAHEAEILAQLHPYRPDCLVLAGYMRVVTATLIDAFHGRWRAGLPGVINIHPADTRQYQGVHGYEFALGLLKQSPRRLDETKITVHFVDKGMDTGPIIAQRTVPISPNDSIEELRARGLAVEHELYPECVDLYARGRVAIVGEEVKVS
jgi:phosphoribosylglycinamide formyltransferase 1